MSTHTSAPWRAVEERDDERIGIMAASQMWVAEVIAYQIGGRDEERANARLIAAAPELLEALRELLASHLTLMPPYGAGKEAQDAWADRQAAARNNAGALISKVTGAA